MVAKNILNDQAARSIPKLGYLVWYEMSGEPGITNEEAKNIVASEGLDPKMYPKANAGKAYHYALGIYRRESYRILVRKLTPKPLTYRHQVTVEEETPTNLAYRAEAFTSLDRETGKLTVEAVSQSAADEHLRVELQAHFAHFTKNLTPDIAREWISSEMSSWNAVTARRSGGLWFVPASQEQRVLAAEQVFERFGFTFYVHPVLDTATWRKNTAGFVEDDLTVDLNTLKRELDETLAQHRDGKIPAYKLRKRVERVDELKNKAETYADLLEITLEGLRKNMDDVQGRLEKILNGKDKVFKPKKYAADLREEGRKKRRAAAQEKMEKAKKKEKMKEKALNEIREFKSNLKPAPRKSKRSAKKVVNAPF